MARKRKKKDKGALVYISPSTGRMPRLSSANWDWSSYQWRSLTMRGSRHVRAPAFVSPGLFAYICR